MDEQDYTEEKTAEFDLSDKQVRLLENQDTRIVSQFKAAKLEEEAKKYWDIFYKRNGNRFFKDRHWTTREFRELIPSSGIQRVLLEVGCGVGNFIFPLLEEDPSSFFIFACDFAPRAVDHVKNHSLYDERNVKAFVADITSESTLCDIQDSSVDVVTLIFVLSAIHPKHYNSVILNLYKKLKPGAVVLFRDYGLYDITQLRFKPGHKIFENFYMRQDGTRSYFFSVDFVKNLFTRNKFEEIETAYVGRRTVNKKENIDVPRIFVQARFRK